MSCRRIYALSLFILTLLLWASLPVGANSPSDFWPTKGWRVSTPEEQGMDSRKLAEAIQSITACRLLERANGYLKKSLS